MKTFRIKMKNGETVTVQAAAFQDGRHLGTKVIAFTDGDGKHLDSIYLPKDEVAFIVPESDAPPDEAK